MGSGEPCIAILMAVYEPRLDWLEEQLRSLNDQTYPELRLYVRDDCSPTVPFADIERLVKECVRSIPYELKQNEKNLGSNGTFELLTKEAEGAYFAYCDQDDIWLPEKLAVLREELERSGALLACSDMYIIDGEGRQTADSMTRIRRRHVFRSGEGLAEGLLTTNFVTGCTMLVRSRAAKDAVPFCPYMVHDHYIALYCAARGAVRSVPRQLIRYRIHGGNQTGVMAGVTDKESYGRVRIERPFMQFQWLQAHFPCEGALKEAIREGCIWLEARRRNWSHRGGRRQIWRYRRFSRALSLFELFAPEMPEEVFRLFVAARKRNWV